MKPIHVVGAAILRGSRCLVAQRGESMTLPLKWEFPGGKVEPEENPRDALAREVREELGVNVEIGGLLGRGESVVHGRRILLDVYEAHLESGTPKAREHKTLRWCDAREVERLDWAAADQPLIAPLIARLTRQSS